MMQTTEGKKRNPTVAAEVAKKIGVSENTYRDMKTVTNEGNAKGGKAVVKSPQAS